MRQLPLAIFEREAVAPKRKAQFNFVLFLGAGPNDRCARYLVVELAGAAGMSVSIEVDRRDRILVEVVEVEGARLASLGLLRLRKMLLGETERHMRHRF